MNYTITIPCSDGCDPECKKEMTYYLDYAGLTNDQIEEIKLREGQALIALSPEQMEMNRLTTSDGEYCNEQKQAWVNIDLDSVCSFCAE